MRLTLRTTRSTTWKGHDAGVDVSDSQQRALNAATYALPAPDHSFSLASYALLALASSLDSLDIDRSEDQNGLVGADAAVLDDIAPEEHDLDADVDPRVWAALTLAYGNTLPPEMRTRRAPLSDPYLHVLPQLVVLDFSGPGAAIDDGAMFVLRHLVNVVVLDLADNTSITAYGIGILAYPNGGPGGLRALSLRGCTAIVPDALVKAAQGWPALDVLDARGTACSRDTAVPGFAPRPPAAHAAALFHPRTALQVARALLGGDEPLVLVDKLDFAPRARPSSRKTRPPSAYLDDPACGPVSATDQPAREAPARPADAPRTAPLPARDFPPRERSRAARDAGQGVVSTTQPDDAPPTLEQLRQRRLAAFDIASPASGTSVPPAVPLSVPAVSGAALTASSSAPAGRAATSTNAALVTAAAARWAVPAASDAAFPSSSWALARAGRPSVPPIPCPSAPAGRPSVPAVTPAKRRKTAAAPDERARFVERLSDEGALMFVRVGPSSVDTPKPAARARVDEVASVRVAPLATVVRPPPMPASASTPVVVPATPAQRKVPFGRGAVARKGLSTWHHLEVDEDEGEPVMREQRPPVSNAKLAPSKKTVPSATTKRPASKQTTLPFARVPKR